jgi:hypothetical protein
MKTILMYSIIVVVIGFAQVASAIPVTVGYTDRGLVNGLYTVDIIISNIPTGGAVAAYNLDFLYNTERLSATGITFKYGLGMPDTKVDDPTVMQDSSKLAGSARVFTPGVFDMYALSLFRDPDLLAWQTGMSGYIHNGVLTLATLTFADLGGSNDLGFSFAWSAGLDVKGLGNEIIAGYVPEPGTFLLVGSGLLGLFGFRRRGNLLSGFRKQGR